MATNDTDPQQTQPFGDDPSRTEPGAPPAADHAADHAADDAAALLANLSDSSLPTDDVKETEGHVAAAYAAAPHRPPRANDKTVENPAVLINATVPLPQPPSSGRVKLGPPAPSVVSMNGAPTVIGGARFVEAQTDPGERTRNQTRVILASIAGVVVAALIAITILALMGRRAQPTATSSTTSSSAQSAATSAATNPSDPPSNASPTTTTTPPTSPTTTAATATSKPTTPHGRPHGTTPSSTSPRPSGTFAEPDRNL